MKNFLVILSLCISLPVFAAEQYVTYTNSAYHYELSVPVSWDKTYAEIDGKYFVTFSSGTGAQIEVRSYTAAADTHDNIIHDLVSDLRKTDPSLSTILETNQVTIRQKIEGKLLIVEYRSKEGTMLQRTMVLRQSGMLYIIECRASVKKFYTYDTAFNTAMSSMTILAQAPAPPVPAPVITPEPVPVVPVPAPDTSKKKKKK